MDRDRRRSMVARGLAALTEHLDASEGIPLRSWEDLDRSEREFALGMADAAIMVVDALLGGVEAP